MPIQHHARCQVLAPPAKSERRSLNCGCPNDARDRGPRTSAGAAGGQPESTRRSLTFEHVRSFFSDTLGIWATEVQKRCAIFYEGEWQNANTYRYCVIIVENSDEDLQVTFYITDDREMNWVNEFMDGPFFTRRETEELFRLLNRERHARGEKVGRFRVDVSHWMPPRGNHRL